MKISNDTIGNRTRELLACSAVPQSTALNRSPLKYVYLTEISHLTQEELTIMSMLRATIRRTSY